MMARGKQNTETTDGQVLRNDPNQIDGEALQRYVERCITLFTDRQDLTSKIQEVFKEARDAGFVTAHLRQLVREQMMEPQVLADQLAQMDTYRRALGQLADTPLGANAL